MKRKWLTLLSVLAIWWGFSAPFASGQNIDRQQGTLTIQREGSPPFEMHAGDLAEFRKIDLRAKDHDEKEYIFSGVALSDVLRKAGVQFGAQHRGKNMAQYLLVRSTDGYEVVFALPELDSTFTDRTILLAYQVDGQPFAPDKGPFRIIVPGEKKHARWIWGVKDLLVRSVKE
jgi:DMSO/TMAO reductase YedYZ molybdopterin-dependent catalytic subunit